MANIVITTVAAIITISVPAGAMVSVNNEPVDTSGFAAVEQTEGQPIDQINVVVEIREPGALAPTQTATVDPALKLPGTAPASSPLPPSSSSSQFNGVTLPQPQRFVTDFNPPQPQNLANGTASPAPNPSSSPANDSDEVTQLREEIAQLRQQLQPPSATTSPPAPLPESTTTTTQVNPRTNQPTSRTVTTVQQGVAATPAPAPTRVPTPNTSTTRGFGSTQLQQQATAAGRTAQPNTTIAPVGAIPSASAAQTVR